MHSVLSLLTTTWLETHQVYSTFCFEFARSTQSAVQLLLISLRFECACCFSVCVIKLLPQDSEHASCLRTCIMLTHVRSEVKLTVLLKSLYLQSLEELLGDPQWSALLKHLCGPLWVTTILQDSTHELFMGGDGMWVRKWQESVCQRRGESVDRGEGKKEDGVYWLR